MPTIIDSFITEFTIDPTGQQKGGAAVREATKKTREEVAGATKDFDTYGKRASQFFGRLRNEAVGLFLAFQGASSIKSYISDILTGDAATGRLAANIGVATQELSAWQLAIKTVGGTAEDANNALSSIAEAYQTFNLTGELPNYADFMGLGIGIQDLDNPANVLLKMAEAAERMDQTEFYARMRRIGIPDSVINQLVKGRAATELLIEEKKKEGAATDEQAKKAEEYQKKLADLEAKITGLLRPALYRLVTVALDFVEALEDGNAAIPIMTGLIGALLLSAGAAAAPFVALAAAIGAVGYAMDSVIRNSPKLRSFLDGVEAPIKKWLGPGWEWLFERPGDLQGNSGSSGESAYRGTGGGGGTGPVGSGAKAREDYIRGYLKASGFTDEQVRGIMAGMYAENTSFDPNVRGGYKGRAVGVGQWLGPRRAKLLARYGPNPTLQQQMAFLVEELKGGDKGGASVLNSTTAAETASNYIGGEGWGFMRPGVEGRASDMGRVNRYLGRGPSIAAGRASRPSAAPAGATTHIGTIVVHTAATDAEGVARDLPGAIRRRSLAAQANRGLE